MVEEIKTAEGHAIDDDDMHWTVNCPSCDKEFEFEGYFDSSDETKCKCGCIFLTKKVYFEDDSYMQ